MLDVRSQHVDSVDVRIRQQVMIIREYFCAFAAVFLACFFGTLRDNVTECIHINPVALGGHAGEMLVKRNAAAADKTDF